MRQTGGTAVGATSTRSSPFSWARLSAWDVGMTPSCCPSSSMTRTSRILIISLIRRSLAIVRPLLQQTGHQPIGRVAHFCAKTSGDYTPISNGRSTNRPADCLPLAPWYAGVTYRPRRRIRRPLRTPPWPFGITSHNPAGTEQPEETRVGLLGLLSWPISSAAIARGEEATGPQER